MMAPGTDDGASDKEKMSEVYIIASCCDWMPVKMKTKRHLLLEKIPMMEPAPVTILNVDNANLIYANLVAPGFHYFYMIQGAEKCFLSPRYPIVRFKDTQVFLNRVHIEPKVHEFENVFTLKEGAEDEELFLIDHSVFARYEVEQLPDRSKMIFKGFELDVKWSKLFRVCKSDEAELSRVKMKLWEHFQRISNIFLWEIGRSDKP